MRIQTAAYIAIAIHFLRTIYRKISVKPTGFPGAAWRTDRYILARTYATPMITVLVAKVHKGASIQYTLQLKELIDSNLDKCHVGYATEHDLEAIRSRETVYTYSEIPDLDMSHSHRLNLAGHIYAALPASFLDQVELY